MLAAVGLLATLPRAAFAGPKKQAKSPSPAEYRPSFAPRKTLSGELAALDDARMSLRRPQGWTTRPAGKQAFAMAKSEPGDKGAIFATHLALPKRMEKAPVGLVLQDAARKLLARFGSYRKGSSKLAWEVVDMPMAYRRADGRAGRMVARAKTKKGEVIVGYIAVVLERGRTYALAGFWNESLTDEFLPAADTMFSSMVTR